MEKDEIFGERNFFLEEKKIEREKEENISIFALYPSISIEMCGKEIEQKTD